MRTTDILTGLTNDEAKKQMEAGFGNTAVKNQSKTIGQIIAGNVFTYFNLIFAIFAVLLILVRSYINMTFLPIVICNTLIGIIQEIRSKKVLDRLNLMNEPKTIVIREGEEFLIESSNLVKSDLCIFKAGNQICADAIVAEGSVRVNEALLTGEADEVIKHKGDMLYSGSFVVSGSCKAILENVGLNSYAAKIMMEAKASRKKQQTEMMRSLDGLVKLIGVAIIPIGILLYVQHRFFLNLSAQESVVAMIASLVGMIPEGLYLLASIALVVSVMRLGKRKVLVHEMACVETLARVNVLCVDKTGTITENHMSVQEIVPLNEKTAEQIDNTGLHSCIGDTVANLDSDNITMQALKNYFNEESKRKAVRVVPFSSETKYSAAVFEEETFVIGAAENVLLQTYAEHEPILSSFIGDGIRVLVFGRLSEEYHKDFAGGILTEPIIPLAYILLSNPIRPEAKETFEYFRRQGVEVKVISGDNAKAASEVAKNAGIYNAQNYIDLSGMTEEEVRNAAQQYTVFGRVSPEQKKYLVQALKDSKKVVAMTGDGVNDVLALKCADCSVAMASGSEAAANAAQIVLLESDFSKMPSVVLEGRRVVNNIQRSASLFLIKNLFSMFMTIFTLILVNKYPLYPTQLSLLGAFTIGAPAFLLALQPNKNIIQGHFLTNVVIKALPAGLTDFIMVALLTLGGNFMGLEMDKLSTMCIMVLLAIGMSALIRICMPFDLFRLVTCCAMLSGIVFSVIFLKPVFAVAPLALHQWIITGVLMVLAMVLFKYMCMAVNNITAYIAKHNKWFRYRLEGRF